MDDQHRQRLVEIYEGAALAILMHDAMEEDGKRLRDEFEQAKAKGDVPEVPASLDLKCRKLIDKAITREARKERMDIILRASAKVAVTVLLLIGLSTVTILSVEALRIPVLNFLLDPSGKFQTVVLDPAQKVESDGHTTVEQFEKFVPVGYGNVQREHFPDGSCFISFSNNEGHYISLDVMPAEGSLNIDAEDVNYVSMTINDCAVVFSEKNGCTMMWIDETTEKAFTLRATGLDKDTFLELAYMIIV